MIRLRHITAVLALSLLGIQVPAKAQEGLPSTDDDGPGEPEGPSDRPNLPAGVKTQNPAGKNADGPAADKVPDGQELVSIDFPEPTEIKDIIRAVSLWVGKNVIIGSKVSGKVQMISPRKVTKEEAYQAFLSALNVAGFTTVETGKIIKIVPTNTAVKDNLNIYQGSNWSPRTDKLITQIVPLRYIDAKQVQSTLTQLVPSNSVIPYAPTNTLIISDTGYRVRRILKIIEMLDVAGQAPKVALVPIRYGDAKSIAAKITEIITASQTSGRGGSRVTGSTGSGAAFKVSVDERSNSVIIFGPPRTIQDVKDLIKKFDFPIDDPANQASIRVRFLDYADATKIAATLSSLAQGQSASSRLNAGNTPIRSIGNTTGRTRRLGAVDEPAAVADLGDNVKITADQSSNSLLITGSRSAYEAINGIIRKLDRRRPQVYVEADILDVNISNGFNFGTSLFLGSESGGTKQAYGWQGKQVAPLIIGSSKSNQANGSNTISDQDRAAIAGALAQDFTIGVLAGKAIDIPGIGPVTPAGLITMLKADSNSRVLSSPHLLTSNNEPAKILVGDTIFYKAATQSAILGGGAISDVKKEEANLQLDIKPNISHAGNYITMKVDLEANEGGLDQNTGVPKINKRQTSQLVTIKSGQTVVISGLVKRRETEVFQKIPLLGDIPILGWLFRNSATQKETTSLMIFMTPHVVYGANDLSAIYDRKIKERDELMTAAFGTDSDDEFVKALPTKEDGQYKSDELDAMEDRAQEVLKKQMREDRGLLDESEGGKPGSADGENGNADDSNVPMPMNGFDDQSGGAFDGGNISPGGSVDGAVQQNPPSAPEPVDIPEPFNEVPLDN